MRVIRPSRSVKTMVAWPRGSLPSSRGTPIPGARNESTTVVAGLHELDRRDLRRMRGASPEPREHGVAPRADELVADALVHDVRGEAGLEGLEVAPAKRVDPVGEDDLEVAGRAQPRRLGRRPDVAHVLQVLLRR